MIKILKSALVIGIVAVFAVKATTAVWSDSGQSTGNTFAAGTLDLQLSDNDEPYADSVTVSWTGSDMYPGGPAITETLNIRNNGSVNADHVHFSVANDITEDTVLPNADDADPITNHLQVTTLTYDAGSGPTDILNFNLISDSQPNGYMDLADLEAAGQIGMSTGAISDNPPQLELADLGGDHPLVMSVKLNGDSPDENQGDQNTMTLTATLHQTDGQ